MKGSLVSFVLLTILLMVAFSYAQNQVDCPQTPPEQCPPDMPDNAVCGSNNANYNNPCLACQAGNSYFTYGSCGQSNQDSDGDGVYDWMETSYGLNPNNPDTDGDGYQDGYEMQNGWDPLNPSMPGTQEQPQTTQSVQEAQKAFIQQESPVLTPETPVQIIIEPSPGSQPSEAVITASTESRPEDNKETTSISIRRGEESAKIEVVKEESGKLKSVTINFDAE
ncbi:MAG TPA: hypothetical protein VJC07_02700 [Candidatus Nanoarchaeia archaeon]|nr:hypothetical protein [Candidatus Nanoarchaeia archaeon]